MNKGNSDTNKVIVNSSFLEYLTDRVYYPSSEEKKGRMMLVFVCKNPKGTDKPLQMFATTEFRGIEEDFFHYLQKINTTSLSNLKAQYFRKGKDLYVKTQAGSVYKPYIFLAKPEYKLNDVVAHVEKIHPCRLSNVALERYDKLLSNTVTLHRYIPLSGGSYVNIEIGTIGKNLSATFTYQVVVSCTRGEYLWYTEPTAYLKLNYPEIYELTQKYGKYHTKSRISKKCYDNLLKDLKNLSGKYKIYEDDESMKKARGFNTDRALIELKKAYNENYQQILLRAENVQDVYTGIEIVEDFVRNRRGNADSYDIYLSQIPIGKQCIAFKGYCKNYAYIVYKNTGVIIDPKVLEASHKIYYEYVKQAIQYKLEK